MTEAKDTTAEAPAKEVNKPLPKNAPQPPGDIRRRKGGPKRTGPFVKYVGQASHRKITPAQWRSLNIPLEGDVKEHLWSVGNDKMIESDPDTAPDMVRGRDWRRVLTPRVPDVQAIRRKLHMSQSEFATRFGFSVRTVQEWEQGRALPIVQREYFSE